MARVIRRGLALSVLVAAIFVAGCGGDSDPGAVSTEGTPAGTGPAQEDAPSVDADAFADADPGDVEVIRGWTDALRSGDIRAAASFFALPSVAENGATLIQISTRGDARGFNRALPCGAHLIGASSVGEFTTAEFELTERPGAGTCGAGVGANADAAFVIRNGEIAEWRRVSSDGQPPPSGSTA